MDLQNENDQSENNDLKDDLLSYYGTTDEHEVAILMPVPERLLQMQLLRAYDLNPLI